MSTGLNIVEELRKHESAGGLRGVIRIVAVLLKMDYIPIASGKIQFDEDDTSRIEGIINQWMASTGNNYDALVTLVRQYVKEIHTLFMTLRSLYNSPQTAPQYMQGVPKKQLSYVLPAMRAMVASKLLPLIGNMNQNRDINDPQAMKNIVEFCSFLVGNAVRKYILDCVQTFGNNHVAYNQGQTVVLPPADLRGDVSNTMFDDLCYASLKNVAASMNAGQANVKLAASLTDLQLALVNAIMTLVASSQGQLAQMISDQDISDLHLRDVVLEATRGVMLEFVKRFTFSQITSSQGSSGGVIQGVAAEPMPSVMPASAYIEPSTHVIRIEPRAFRQEQNKGAAAIQSKKRGYTDHDTNGLIKNSLQNNVANTLSPDVHAVTINAMALGAKQYVVRADP